MMTAAEEPVLIQPMSAHHVDSFHRAFDAVARERRFLTFLEAPSLEDTRAFVAASLSKGNPHVVAVAAETVVGWCDIQRHSFPAHAHRGSLGMGLTAPYRGKGLGQQLVAAALKRAWEIGLTRIELSVHADNTSAVALYRKMGFAEEGLVRCAFLADDIYRDAIMMAIIQPADGIRVEGKDVS